MSSELQHIEESVKTVESLTDQFVNLTGGRVDQANEALDHDIHTLELSVRLRVASIEAVLIPPLANVYQSAVYHTLRAYWHASPSLILILAAIWAAIKVVWTFVQYLIQIVNIIKSLRLDDLMANYWVWFAEAREKFRDYVAGLSDALGWGVDGLLHLLHATQSFTDVLGGLMGKSWTWCEAEFMVKTGNILDTMQKTTRQISEDPGRMLEVIFQGEMSKSFGLSLDFGENLLSTIEGGIMKTKIALYHISNISNELAAIQEGMPEIIRKNIPQSIWTSLETFTHAIDTEILPRLLIAEKHLALVNSLIDLHSNKFNDIAGRLAHPGTNLLTIDDLPSYAREMEEWAIDDVASRKFGAAADSERVAMQPDLAAFALIDAAAKSPLPALPFMTIEEPGRAALYGITAEPHETWFIGGYNDQL